MVSKGMLAILFLFSFSLHNLEEALWLPAWSRNAGRFHPHVSKNQFYFAVLVVTVLGYLITFQYFVFGTVSALSRSVFFGFVFMMVANAIFPHLLVTIALRRYAPGTITALLLNVPVRLYVLRGEVASAGGLSWPELLASGAVVSLFFLILLRPLFFLGGVLFDETGEPSSGDRRG